MTFGLSTRALALGAAAIALGVLVVYVASLLLEDDADPSARTALVAGSLAAAGVLAVAAALLDSPGLQLVLLTAVATALIVWGVLGLASIGIPLLVGALLAAGGARAAAEHAPPDAFRASIATAVAVGTALSISFALT